MSFIPCKPAKWLKTTDKPTDPCDHSVSVFFPCSCYSSPSICYSSVVSSASSANAATPAANIPVAFVLIVFILSSPYTGKWLCISCSAELVHFQLDWLIFYGCLSSPPQTDHLIVAQHPQEGLRDRKHRGEERLCRCILPCPLLSRSDSSSLSNVSTISLIKEEEEEELSYFPPLSSLRSELLTPLNFRKTPFTAFIWAFIQSRRACRFFQKWRSIWKCVPLGCTDSCKFALHSDFLPDLRVTHSLWLVHMLTDRIHQQKPAQRCKEACHLQQP